MWMGTPACLFALAVLLPGQASAAEAPVRDEVAGALRKAVGFYHTQVARGGGYVYRYSGDTKLREGEGHAGDTLIWVQPPGTPAVGEAFLQAYAATGDAVHLDAARDAAHALVRGQLRTGGWYYSVETDPARRSAYGYRDQPKRKGQEQKTTLDDDTTQAATRFLMHVDKAHGFKDEKVHDAALFALGALLRAQFPNGAWCTWWERYPDGPRATEYPILPASFPETWSRTWTKDFTGCYVTNDNLVPDMIAVMLDAFETYGDERYRASALKAGDFLVLAQMPDPQPAWAQQYDRNMHPVWGRKFEPPAVSGWESQAVLETLMLLARQTGERKYLAPIPRALDYLRRSRLPDGRLARFYELRTNRPLYFTRDYQLTYDLSSVPTHYSFVVECRLDAIRSEYERLMRSGLSDPPAEKAALTPELLKETRRVLAAMDARGAWVERGKLKSHGDVKPPSGVLDSRTFIANVATLCRYLETAK